MTIIDNDTVPPTTNPADDARFFARQHYLDFLNREPDQSGWDFWTNAITQCGTDAACIEVHRINVSAAFFVSNEFQNTGYLAYVTHRVGLWSERRRAARLRCCTTSSCTTCRSSARDTSLQPDADQVLEKNKVAFFNEFVSRPAVPCQVPGDLQITVRR